MFKNKKNQTKGITLIALVITTIFSYDENPTSNLEKIINFQIFKR